MTCIVALEHEGAVWIGADSFMGGADFRDQTDRQKLLLRPGIGIGFAGSFRGAQIIEHQVSLRSMRANESPHKYLVSEVAHKVRSAFMMHGTNCREEGTDSHDTELLVCLRGQVWMIQADYSAVRSAHGYSAIGAGAAYALGALSATSRKASPRSRVLAALSVSAKFCPKVAAPFHVAEVT